MSLESHSLPTILGDVPVKPSRTRPSDVHKPFSTTDHIVRPCPAGRQRDEDSRPSPRDPPGLAVPRFSARLSSCGEISVNPAHGLPPGYDGTWCHAPVAQLDRALASGARGRRFESCRAYHRCSRARQVDPARPHAPAEAVCGDLGRLAHVSRRSSAPDRSTVVLRCGPAKILPCAVTGRQRPLRQRVALRSLDVCLDVGKPRRP